MNSVEPGKPGRRTRGNPAPAEIMEGRAGFLVDERLYVSQSNFTHCLTFCLSLVLMVLPLKWPW